MRHNNANNKTPPPTTHTRHTRHFQKFDKIDSFLKPVWNIFILGNLIVAWEGGGGGGIKAGAAILRTGVI